VEKQKFVYVLNRDASANLTISSPLEAHKSHTIVFHLTALDCGFDNPIFAAIELDYADADQVRVCGACRVLCKERGRGGREACRVLCGGGGGRSWGKVLALSPPPGAA
jgi:hypothetical protein